MAVRAPILNPARRLWPRRILTVPPRSGCERASLTELESSVNPQPGKAALRRARFPARAYWRLSIRPIAVLSRCALLGLGAHPALEFPPQAWHSWPWPRTAER